MENKFNLITCTGQSHQSPPFAIHLHLFSISLVVIRARVLKPEHQQVKVEHAYLKKGPPCRGWKSERKLPRSQSASFSPTQKLRIPSKRNSLSLYRWWWKTRWSLAQEFSTLRFFLALFLVGRWLVEKKKSTPRQSGKTWIKLIEWKLVRFLGWTCFVFLPFWVLRVAWKKRTKGRKFFFSHPGALTLTVYSLAKGGFIALSEGNQGGERGVKRVYP